MLSLLENQRNIKLWRQERKVCPSARFMLLTWPPCCLIRACVVFWCWITLRSLSTNAAWSLGMNPRYARFSDVYKRIKTLMSHVCGEEILVKWTQPACNQNFTTIMDKMDTSQQKQKSIIQQVNIFAKCILCNFTVHCTLYPFICCCKSNYTGECQKILYGEHLIIWGNWGERKCI